MVADGGTDTTLRLPLDVPSTPKLTAKQQHALEILIAAGPEGVTPRFLGAQIHATWKAKHTATDRCDFCGTEGTGLLKALRRKGVARQRRVDGRVFWQATGLRVSGMSEDIGF